eukprot:4313756-Pleurochrysis_carterae.AAC.1
MLSKHQNSYNQVSGRTFNPQQTTENSISSALLKYTDKFVKEKESKEREEEAREGLGGSRGEVKRQRMCREKHRKKARDGIERVKERKIEGRYGQRRSGQCRDRERRLGRAGAGMRMQD